MTVGKAHSLLSTLTLGPLRMVGTTFPTVYTDEMYQIKSDLVYQHVFENYFGSGKSVYAEAS